MRRARRSSAGEPLVFRNPAMPHMGLVQPDCDGLESRVGWRQSVHALFRRSYAVDGALLLGHEAESSRKAGKDGHVSVEAKGIKEGDREKQNERRAQRESQGTQVVPSRTRNL